MSDDDKNQIQNDQALNILELGNKLVKICLELKKVTELNIKVLQKQSKATIKQEYKEQGEYSEPELKDPPKRTLMVLKTAKYNLVNPDKPKKPESPYVLFKKDFIAKRDPETADPSMNIIQITALRWKELSEAEKNVYKDRYKVLKKLWMAELHKYNQAKEDKSISESDHDTHHQREEGGLKSIINPDLESFHSPNLSDTELEVNHKLTKDLSELCENVHTLKSDQFNQLSNEIDAGISSYQHLPNHNYISNGYEAPKNSTDLKEKLNGYITDSEHPQNLQELNEQKESTYPHVSESQPLVNFESHADLKLKSEDSASQRKKLKKSKKSKKAKEIKTEPKNVNGSEEVQQVEEFLGF